MRPHQWITKLRGKFAAENKDISLILLPTILSMFLCVACLLGATFAWFTSTQTVTTESITAARYCMNISVTPGVTTVAAPNNVYELAPGTYTITLSADPESTATHGYCIIYLGTDVTLHTVPIKTDGAGQTFTLEIHQPVTMEIVQQWGTSSKPQTEWWDGKTIAYGTPQTADNETQPPQETTTEPVETTTVPETTTTVPETTTTATETAVTTTAVTETTVTTTETTTTATETTTTATETTVETTTAATEAVETTAVTETTIAETTAVTETSQENA